MNNNEHKHHYTYAFTSTLSMFDVKALKFGVYYSTRQRTLIGKSYAFYECKDCGKMLITEEF